MASTSNKNKKLIIVESPAKAKTISKFLGKDYIVTSSFGHVRDLPKSKLGIDTENNFEPHYIIPQKAKARVKALKEQGEKVETIILATDGDREGEAIAWHIVQIFNTPKKIRKTTAKKKVTKKPKEEPKPKQFERIIFHEITKKAIEEALTHPRDININLVNAQQARRILDRLVGYELSPFLWKKLMRGLSAGRVQSVAVRLIMKREEEIKAFKPKEYWKINASFLTSPAKENIAAHLISLNETKLDKFAVSNETQAGEIRTQLENASYHVHTITKKEHRKSALAPFTTSTLQQDAWRRLRFSAKQTMMIAQQLYEGVEHGHSEGGGLITYMRTDSLTLSETALAQAKILIIKQYGENYALPSPKRFKTKSKGAQEAHEAIRPTHPEKHPDDIKEHLSPQQFKLYDLIWRRFMASQMESAIFDTTAIDISADIAQKPIFRANGIVKKFDGFMACYHTKSEDAVLPETKEKDPLDIDKLEETQHFTEPPARYSEASLVKVLEEFGIGRPSTYAPIISTIQTRGYIEKNEQKRLEPTEIGTKVDNLLATHFPDVVNVDFTAEMEEKFDLVAHGKTQWEDIIKNFYMPFHKNLEKKYEEVEKENMDEPTDQLCEKCGHGMIIKMGRFGKFLACSNFPDCKNTKTIKKTIGMICTQCNEGDIIEKKTKKKRTFWGCSRYPKCEYASWKDPRKKNDDAEEGGNKATDEETE